MAGPSGVEGPTDDPNIGGEPFNVDDAGVRSDDEPKPESDEPLYRVYRDARIAVGQAVGTMWERKLKAALTAYTHVMEQWEQVFRYYNNDQSSKVLMTPRGMFRRGDSTENVVFSNLNVMLPAVYSKDPDISCSTSSEEEEPFCRALEALINALFKRKDGINAKPRVKKSTGMGLLTNFGIMKLDFTKKDDSRELARTQMEEITAKIGQAKTQEELSLLYGQIEALEQNMEVRKDSGPALSNVLPHNLIVDPYAENPDGTDGEWMIERTWLPTNMLTARFTEPEEEGDPGQPMRDRKLIYKPTHKAVFTGNTGARDDGLGLVLEAIESGGNMPTAHTETERMAYLNMYFTECYYVWDKATRRVLLFAKDDWKWPVWVWDDPIQITRFFPYFITSFSMSTGGTVSVGETSYYLDQQDEINDINRQLGRIRRTVFDYFYYNSDQVDPDEAEKFVNALRGQTPDAKRLLGVKAGEHKISDMIQSFAPPTIAYEKLFNKEAVLSSIDRLTNTSDALRGVQFKTNTNEQAVDTYQEAMRLSVGAKVDVVEDVVSDLALSLAEICVQFYTQEDVTRIIGAKLAAGWEQMDLGTFRSTYNLELVAGSMEKPNSVFKKKEAVQVTQAIGQFAQAAPGAVLRIMLRVLEQAFTEVVIKPEDWDLLDQEVQASMAKGVSTGPSSPSGGGQQGQPDIKAQLQQAAQQLNPQQKAQVQQMRAQKKSPQEIAQFILTANQQGQQGNGPTAIEPAQR